jgi:integrase
VVKSASARSTAMVVASVAPAPLAAELVAGADRAAHYAAEARATNTRRTYSSQWRAFCSWMAARGEVSLPASGQQVAIYLAERADAGDNAATLSVALAAISEAHRLAGEPSPRERPEVRETWKGIRRKVGVAQKGKDPLLLDALRRAVDALPVGLAGQRDRALLLLGWAGAFRRSELVGLALADVRIVPQGLAVALGRSKTDQEGRGREVGILRGVHPSSCPVRALQAWLAASGLQGGPLFRAIDRWGHLSKRAISAHHVARLVKSAAASAGLDPAQLSGHSLRSGFVTTAALAKKAERAIMKTTGHQSVETVRGYIRRAETFEDLAAEGLGL